MFSLLTKSSIALEELLEGCVKLECTMFCASLSSHKIYVCLCVSHYLLLYRKTILSNTFYHMLPYDYSFLTI